nr:PAS domain S-box protein [Spirochaetota bacterium]
MHNAVMGTGDTIGAYGAPAGGGVPLDFVELLPQVVFETDAAGIILYVNRIASELSGYSMDELRSGKNILSFLTPECREIAVTNMTEVMAGRRPRTAEYTIIRKDGSTFPVNIYSTAIIRDGNFAGLRGIIVDITDQKQTESALSQSEARFQTLIHNLPYGIVLIAPDGSPEYLNPTFTRLFGYTPADIPSAQAWFERAYPDPVYRASMMALWSETDAEKTASTTTDFVVRCKDGSDKSIQFHRVNIDGGRTILTCIDMTARVKAEEALRESKHELDFITGNMIDLIAHAGPDGRYQYTSPSYQTVLGYSETELRAMSGFDIVHPDDIQRIWATYIEAIINREPRIRYETRLRRKDGEYLPFEVTAKILY